MKTKPLSPIEYTTLWMAIRYAMNRQTIASAMLPGDIIEAYHNRLSAEQRSTIAEDLKRNEKYGFGSPGIDKPIWLKFMACMDDNTHYIVELIDGSKVDVFEANGLVYGVNDYLNRPHIEVYIPKENIKHDTI